MGKQFLQQLPTTVQTTNSSTDTGWGSEGKVPGALDKGVVWSQGVERGHEEVAKWRAG